MLCSSNCSHPKSSKNPREAWASIKELMEKLMHNPSISFPLEYYQGCQELYTYHDKLLGYYGRGNQEDASMRKFRYTNLTMFQFHLLTPTQDFYKQVKDFFVDYVVCKRKVRSLSSSFPLNRSKFAHNLESSLRFNRLDNWMSSKKSKGKFSSKA